MNNGQLTRVCMEASYTMSDEIKKLLKKKSNKNVAECLVYQDKLISEAIQIEFKAPKQIIKFSTREQKLKKTRETLLDRYGFESSDNPHIEKWTKKEK